MASLDLRPDLNLMLVQAAVFATNLYVVNRFFVAPYLRLKDARAKETDGVKEKALRFEKEASSLERDINQRLKETLLEAAEIRAKIKEKAEQEHTSVILQARKASEIEVEKVFAQVEENLKLSRAQLAKEAAGLVSFVCSSLLGAR